jgi:hypothetical protein
MIAALERLAAQNPQPHLAGLALQAALVVAGAGIATRGAALIALRIAQPIRLGIEGSNGTGQDRSSSAGRRLTYSRRCHLLQKGCQRTGVSAQRRRTGIG